MLYKIAIMQDDVVRDRNDAVRCCARADDVVQGQGIREKQQSQRLESGERDTAHLRPAAARGDISLCTVKTKRSQ
jgi:hypothetical protein